jgi:uncharacterized protein (DUF2267 family)
MDYEQFITVVAQGAGVGSAAAERATRATLATLAERLSAGEARDIALELPPQLAPWIGTVGGPAPFDVEEFLRRVAERADVDVPAAERQARAVFTALGQTLSADELHDMASELPKDFTPLLPRGPDVHVLPADEFIRSVAERAGLDRGAARRATDAVLETLAERISGGEVEDLILRLPLELREPLKRGNRETEGAPRRMSLDDFVQRTAEREHASPLDVPAHARAVIATLRDAVGEAEYLDVTNQLPDEYRPLLAHTGRWPAPD